MTRPTDPSRSARRRTALLAVLWLGIWLGFDFARLAHFVAQPHRMCAAHGVLEHADRVAVECAHEHDGQRQSVLPIAAPLQGEHALEHDGCSWSDSDAPRVAWRPALPEAVLARALDGTRVPPDERTPALERLYLLAPKTSPPAARA